MNLWLLIHWRNSLFYVHWCHSAHLNHAQLQEELEFQEDDYVYSVFSEALTDSIGSFEEAYEPSPISVLEHPFGEDGSFGSDSLKFAGDDLNGTQQAFLLNFFGENMHD